MDITSSSRLATSRSFAAASVPHLHWHPLPSSARPRSRTETDRGVPSGHKGKATHRHHHPPHLGHLHGSGKETITEPQNVRRKSDTKHGGEIGKISDTDKSLHHRYEHHHPFHHDDVTPLQRSIASGVGTVFMSVTMNPLDVVKVRLQAQHKLPTKNSNSNSTGNHSNQVGRMSPKPISGIYRDLATSSSLGEKGYQPKPARLTGTVDGFRSIIRNEGFTRLWSGLVPTLLMRIPANVVYFSVYDGLKSQLGFESRHSSDLKSILITIFASGTGRTMSIVLTSPLDLIRTKLYSQYLTYPELVGCLRSGFQAEGIFSLWRGVGSTILRDAPYAILYWTNYELLKTQVMRVYNVTEPTVGITFWAGTASGVFASIVTTPFDVVKTNKQVAIGDVTSGAMSTTRQNTLRMMQQIRAQSGIRGLFAGVGPRVAMSAPASAILITCYEFTLHMFRDYNERQCGGLT
ncbi:probable mitochondrial glutathione transporter SLC25A40 [Lytechinus pictus]|uniref:probable mitochondrial glutathione transporter SLC25A40 n=1 Tax=Lytechinus pictus TaxID=7653 RepID=UPI0030B9F95F